jgi:uncharacterized protein (DUF2141 family)
MTRALCPILTLPFAALALPVPAGAAMVGDVAACASGEPSLRVRVSGFKDVRGTIRVRLYEEGGWLQRGRSLSRLRVPVTSASMDLCVRVPRAGRYAVALHHDINGNRERDWDDGAGFSRNPRLSLTGRPSFEGSAVQVGGRVTPIAIQMMYRRGLAIGPVRSS